MILSMTGFASIARDLNGASLSLDIRAVNHRYLEFSLRAPEDLRMLEPQLRESLAGQLSRGKVECRIALSDRAAGVGAAGSDATIAPDETAIKALLAQQAVVLALHPDARPLAVHEILQWPGVLPLTRIDPHLLNEAVLGAFAEALRELRDSRAREGAKLAQFLVTRLDGIMQLVATARPLVPSAVTAYRTKLAERIAEAAGKVSDERIANEIVLFAARADIEEELARLAAHVDEVRRTLAKGGGIGKRLDFLMQELNREANTLGSKAVAAELTQIAVELKVLIEQMREQVQNIE
jgi:uncharacterized protein (TIGR00255 family)